MLAKKINYVPPREIVITTGLLPLMVYIDHMTIPMATNRYVLVSNGG